jgi:hypothetical protein
VLNAQIYGAFGLLDAILICLFIVFVFSYRESLESLSTGASNSQYPLATHPQQQQTAPLVSHSTEALPLYRPPTYDKSGPQRVDAKDGLGSPDQFGERRSGAGRSDFGY